MNSKEMADGLAWRTVNKIVYDYCYTAFKETMFSLNTIMYNTCCTPSAHANRVVCFDANVVYTQIHSSGAAKR